VDPGGGLSHPDDLFHLVSQVRQGGRGQPMARHRPGVADRIAAAPAQLRGDAGGGGGGVLLLHAGFQHAGDPVMSDASFPLRHHFDDAEQQKEASTLGMWAFLATEVLFFGGLFIVYAVYRSSYPVAFAEASRHLDVTLGTINTSVLIGSSLTM